MLIDWMRVEDQLPTRGLRVLVYQRDFYKGEHGQPVARFSFAKYWNEAWIDDTGDTIYPSHWGLPDPPKE